MYKADLILNTKFVKGVVKVQLKNSQLVIIGLKMDIKKYVPEYVIKDDKIMLYYRFYDTPPLLTALVTLPPSFMFHQDMKWLKIYKRNL